MTVANGFTIQAALSMKSWGLLVDTLVTLSIQVNIQDQILGTITMLVHNQ
jgi:hypothetical protein